MSRGLPNKRGRTWVEPATAESLSDSIIRQVRDALFAGDLRPGDPLGTEKSLAAEFDVSRMAVRDAIRGLVSAGIVVVRQGAGGGARIAEGDVIRLSEAIAVQMVLLGVDEFDIHEMQLSSEVVAAELAARRRTDDDIVRMTALLDDLERAVHDPPTFAAAALDVHLAVLQATHNQAMVAQFSALRTLLEVRYVEAASWVGMPQRVLESHRAVVAKIIAGDAAGARGLMIERMDEVLDMMRAASGEEARP